MPGAPNKPPETTPTPPSALAAAESVPQRVLRRIAPSRVALRLPIWKGPLSPDLVQPFLEAERLFAAGDSEGASGVLDRLAIRFAEPRWPSLPEGFRSLRVPVPTPQPPHWDPDHGLAAAEKEARRFRRYAESQLTLASASLTAEAARGTEVSDLAPLLPAATSALAAGDVGEGFWEPIDRLWSSLRERVPLPAVGPARPVPAAVVEGEGA